MTAIHRRRRTSSSSSSCYCFYWSGVGTHLLFLLLHVLFLGTTIACDLASMKGVVVEAPGPDDSQRSRHLQSNNNIPTSAATDGTGAAAHSSSCVVLDETATPVTGLQVDLRMISRQTRGVLTIVDNCHIQVSRLEIYLHEDEMYLHNDGDDEENENQTSSQLPVTFDWYGALSLEQRDVANATLLHKGLMSAKTTQTETDDVVSFVGNTTFMFETLYDLSTVGAILLVERTTGDNDYNSTQDTVTDDTDLHLLPENSIILGQALIQKLVPGPAQDLLLPQATMFENCWTVSDDARIRWSIINGTWLEVGLEYVVPFFGNNGADDTWMSFGPALPGVQDRLMGGSDVVVAGFRSSDHEQGDGQDQTFTFNNNGEDEDGTTTIPFAHDYYIGGYDVCTKLPADREKTHDGVCRDSVWLSNEDGGGNDNDDDDVELLYAHTLEGVAFLRYRRPLVVTQNTEDASSSLSSSSSAAAAAAFVDHNIVLGTRQNFVWARGPLDPSAGIAEVQFHGYRFGQLKDVDLNETKWTCPPLKGVQLVGDDVEDLDDTLLDNNGDDEFTSKFQYRTWLEGDIVEVFWTPMVEASQIHIGARANVRGSSWLSIALGDTMTDAWAWVAITEQMEVLGYRMDGLDATTVRILPEEDSNNVLFAGPSNVILQEGGLLSFEVIAPWPLPGMAQGDDSAPIIWAIGPSWNTDGETPKREDEHSVRSKVSTRVDFVTGVSSAGKETSNPLMLAHGAVMWVAWLVLAPLTGIASRYIRDDAAVPEWLPLWIVLHKRLAMAVLIFSLIGLVLAVVAVSETGLRHILSSHAKIGITVLVLLVVQNFLGTQRPSPNPSAGWHKRRMWEYQHRFFALAMLLLAVASTITGSIRLDDFDSTTRYGVELTVAWIGIIAVLFTIYEIRRRNLIKSSKVSTKAQEDENDEEQCEGDVGKQKAPTISPCLGTWRLVYVVPATIALVTLIAMTAVTFTDPSSLSSQPNNTTLSTEATASSSSTSPPTVYEGSKDNAPQGCLARPQQYVGDSWCDDHDPFNTIECGWDGGDCCNTSAPIFNCKDPTSINFGKSSQTGFLGPLPIPRNPRYGVEREETLESWVISYNNYYEFGLSKDIVEEANRHSDFLAPEDWFVEITGLVDNPMTLDVKSLIDQMHLEERLYRHRCVEAWSITSQWIGFPLSKLLDMVQPTSDATIVRFTSWKDFKRSPVQETTNYPWPYTEALTMEEARNELTMVTVGAFGKPLTPQSGAPIRLNVPWKYGFKSIKSFRTIEFLSDDVADSRRTFWSTANSMEYGFYANVNPDVPHQRWSQATERHFVTGHPGQRLDTTRMNGYQRHVDYLYDDLEDPAIYY